MQKDELVDALKQHKKDIKELTADRMDVMQKQLDDIATGQKIAAFNSNGTDNNEIKRLVEKAGLESFATNKSGEREIISLKADTLLASITSNTNAFRTTQSGQLQYQMPTIASLFNKVVVPKNSGGKVVFADWNNATSVRAAAMRAEGAVFPESTAKWVENSIEIKKLADSIPFSEELFYDEARFAEELRQFLVTNIMLLEDTQIYSGDNTGNNIKGLVTYASAYTAPKLDMVTPNLADLVLKMVESISTSTNFKPDFVLINPAQLTELMLTKKTDGEYIDVPYFDSSTMKIAGLRVIATSTVTDNTLLIGESSRATIYIDGMITLSVGWENQQFTSDMATLKAKMRENLLIKARDAGAFLKCTDIDAALVLLADTPA